MPFVLDASVSACWAFDDEDHPAARLALERLRTDQAWVPSLWWFEIRNILVVNERRSRIAAADSGAFLGYLAQLAIRLDSAPDESGVLALARRRALSVYDAAYLELAYRKRLPLATLDVKLGRAAQAEGVPVLTP